MPLRPWQRVVIAMFAVAWGANQFSPMLVVYRDELGLSARTLALLFALYAVGLIRACCSGVRRPTAAGAGRRCSRSWRCRPSRRSC